MKARPHPRQQLTLAAGVFRGLVTALEVCGGRRAGFCGMGDRRQFTALYRPLDVVQANKAARPPSTRAGRLPPPTSPGARVRAGTCIRFAGQRPEHPGNMRRRQVHIEVAISRWPVMSFILKLTALGGLTSGTGRGFRSDLEEQRPTDDEERTMRS
jgi:hypothetical protein